MMGHKDGAAAGRGSQWPVLDQFEGQNRGGHSAL